jgi:O-antigen ligase
MLNVLLFFSTYFAGVLLTFRSTPAFAFALYQAIYFFYPQGRWWGGMVPNLSYSFFTVLLMAFALIVNFSKANENKLHLNKPFRYMYLLVFLYIVASFYAVFPEFHQFSIINYVKLAIIMSIAYKLINVARDLDIALYSYIFGSWYISFVTFQVGRNSGDRVAGIGMVDSPDSNGTAASIAPSLVLILYYFWTSKNKLVKGLLVLAGAFIANAVVLINSRGAFLGVAVSIAYFIFHMFFSKFQRKNQKLTVIFLVLFGLIGVAVVADDSFIERMATITEEKVSEDQESGATRTAFWAAAWEMAKDHPIGAGVSGFQFYAPKYIAKNVHTGRGRNRAVHSSWFEALSEVGYPGFVALILMVLTCFSLSRKTRAKLKSSSKVDEYFKMYALEGALIAFLITMTFLNRVRADVFYWCILYIACAYNIYVIKAVNEEKMKEESNLK